MELEGSLPCSQEPSTDPYPEPETSSHTFPSSFPVIHSNIILMPTLGLLHGLFPSGFRTKILYTFIISPMCATILSYLTWSL